MGQFGQFFVLIAIIFFQKKFLGHYGWWNRHHQWAQRRKRGLSRRLTRLDRWDRHGSGQGKARGASESVEKDDCGKLQAAKQVHIVRQLRGNFIFENACRMFDKFFSAVVFCTFLSPILYFCRPKSWNCIKKYCTLMRTFHEIGWWAIRSTGWLIDWLISAHRKDFIIYSRRPLRTIQEVCLETSERIAISPYFRP